MKKSYKHWRSRNLPISTKLTINSHLKSLNTKRALPNGIGLG